MSDQSENCIKQSVSLPRDVAKWLKALAKTNSTTVSRLVQDAIRAQRLVQDGVPSMVKEGACAYGSESAVSQHSVTSALKHIAKEFDIPEQECWDCLMKAIIHKRTVPEQKAGTSKKGRKS